MDATTTRRQRECTPEEGQRWEREFGDGYATGRGDARGWGWDRAPRIELIEIPPELPFENGAQYVARHVDQAWAIGYTRAWRHETGRRG